MPLPKNNGIVLPAAIVTGLVIGAVISNDPDIPLPYVAFMMATIACSVGELSQVCHAITPTGPRR
ncbi:MAG: hypothetical protein CMF50_02355 [Legionellales bacterium]|nr:hypothetical protein [Legionellales bacterium]